MNTSASNARSSARPPSLTGGAVSTVHQGDCLVSDRDDVTLATVLGSCISACIYDRVAKVGGMNHFLLAEQSGSARDLYGASARYGAFAMEQLINSVLAKGSGRKGNLEIKVFGGGKISGALADVGATNAAFVRNFLSAEGYEIAGEDMGGTFARKVVFHPTTGKAFVKRLDSMAATAVAREEADYAGRQTKPAPAGGDADIELF